MALNTINRIKPLAQLSHSFTNYQRIVKRFVELADLQTIKVSDYRSDPIDLYFFSFVTTCLGLYVHVLPPLLFCYFFYPQVSSLNHMEPAEDLISSGNCLPFVLKNQISDWPANKWTPQYLASQLTDNKYRCKIAPKDDDDGNDMILISFKSSD